LKDGDGNSLGSLTGEIEMPEISSDMENDGEDWEVRLSYGEDKDKIRSRIENNIKKDVAN
jgi:hypothetical protein